MFEPFIRDVDPPLTEHMLQPLDPRCRVVQFNRGLSEGDYRRLADFLLTYPDVTLRFYGGYDRKPTNLDLLRFFSHTYAPSKPTPCTANWSASTGCATYRPT